MPTARAAVFVAPRQPLELREYPLPEPGADEILVQITQTKPTSAAPTCTCGAAT